MERNLWSRRDLANILRTVAASQLPILEALPRTPEITSYRAGCRDTLLALCQAFDLPADSLSDPVHIRSAR